MHKNSDSIHYLRDHLAKTDCDHYEIYISQVASTSIEVKDQNIDCFTTAQSTGLSLRVIKDDRIGFSYTTLLSPESFDQIVSNALTSAINSSPDELYGFPEQSLQPVNLDLLDTQFKLLSKDEKIERLKQIERDAFSLDKRITKVRKAAYYEQEVNRKLINSHGLNLLQSDTLFTTSIVVVAEENGDSQTGWDFDFNRFYAGLQTDTLGSSASKKALSLLGAQSAASFRGTVVLDSSVAYQFLGILAQSFLAESVQKKKSILRGKLDKKIFSDKLSIVDDGLYPGGMSTAPFDGEGVAKQRTPLIDGGVFVRFLYDTYCAKKDKTQSTGNSSRGSSKTPPQMGYSNLYITEGNSDQDDILSSVDRGLFVNDVMGIHTANPISGDFSLGITGFLINGGKKGPPVKGMALSGNILTLFENIELVGSDLRFYGKIGSPTIMIAEMDISGT
jgi:PmbA protein